MRGTLEGGLEARRASTPCIPRSRNSADIPICSPDPANCGPGPKSANYGINGPGKGEGSGAGGDCDVPESTCSERDLGCHVLRWKSQRRKLVDQKSQWTPTTFRGRANHQYSEVALTPALFQAKLQPTGGVRSWQCASRPKDIRTTFWLALLFCLQLQSHIVAAESVLQVTDAVSSLTTPRFSP